jgi:hypothetical protein
MVNVKYCALVVATVFIYTACTKVALANNANATKSAEKTAPAGPPKDAPVAGKRSRQTVGLPEYTFATVVNGKQSSTLKTRW